MPGIDVINLGVPGYSSAQGVFVSEHGSDLQGKLGLRVLGVALPDTGGFKVGDVLRTAVRAPHHAVRPADFAHRPMAVA